LSNGRASQPEPVQAQDALEMCEQHLDLLTSREYREMFCGTSFRHIGEVESITLDIAFYGTGSSSRKYLMLQHPLSLNCLRSEQVRCFAGQAIRCPR
jgi:hypothetical protein